MAGTILTKQNGCYGFSWAQQAADFEVITQRILERDSLCISGQNRVPMDLRTTYQRCHELQYEQFKSVRELVGAVCDYQYMAPKKLTDTFLEEQSTCEGILVNLI